MLIYKNPAPVQEYGLLGLALWPLWSRIGPILLLLVRTVHFGPVRKTIESTEAVTGIEQSLHPRNISIYL